MASIHAQPADPEPLSLLAQRLSGRWPGREQQIRQLVGFIGCRASATPNLLVYGPASTGKTSIVRNVLEELKRPYTYTSCAEFSKPRQLLQSILNQLKGRKRKRADGYSGSCKSEQIAEFLADLPGLSKASCIEHIVIDHAHRVADEDVLAVLLKIRRLTGCKLGVVLLSRVAWASGAFEFDTMRAPRPIQIPFPAYDSSSIAQILVVASPIEVEKEGLSALKAFLRAEILPTFARSTCRLEDLQALVGSLLPLYLKPVTCGVTTASDTKRLHSLFQPTLFAAKSAFESGAGWKGALADISSGKSLRSGKPAAAQLDFELPYCSKCLLVAAYICSRSKASLDRRVFDLASRSGKRHGHMSHDRQVEAAREAALKGPHSFSLERMLAVSWHLLNCDDEEAGGVPDTIQQSGDIFMQITSLVSLRLLSKVSSDELEEVKYKCNIPESLATTIAKNISIKLQDYILYA